MKFETLKELNSFVREHLTGYFYISGGVLYDIEHGLPSKDIDIYFRTENDFNKALKDLETQEQKVTKVEESRNAVTFHIHCTKKSTHSLFSNLEQVEFRVVQLIRRNFGDPSEVLKDFDIPKLRKYLENGELHYATTYEDVFIPDVPVNIRGGYIRRILRYIGKGENITKEDLFRVLRTYLDTPNLTDYYSGDEECPYLLLFKVIQSFIELELTPSEKHEVFEFILEELHKKYPDYILKNIEKEHTRHHLMKFYALNDFDISMNMKLLINIHTIYEEPKDLYKSHPKLKEYYNDVREAYPELFL